VNRAKIELFFSSARVLRYRAIATKNVEIARVFAQTSGRTDDDDNDDNDDDDDDDDDALNKAASSWTARRAE